MELLSFARECLFIYRHGSLTPHDGVGKRSRVDSGLDAAVACSAAVCEIGVAGVAPRVGLPPRSLTASTMSASTSDC